MPCSQVAFDKLTVDSAHQQASAAAAASTAANQKASFGDQMAKATLYAFDQKAQFEGQMAEAKLAAGDMQCAFDKLTCDNTDQKVSVLAHHSSLPSISLHFCSTGLIISSPISMSPLHSSGRLRPADCGQCKTEGEL